MKTKNILLSVLPLITAVLLTACNGASEPDTSTAEPTTTSITTTAPTTTTPVTTTTPQTTTTSATTTTPPTTTEATTTIDIEAVIAQYTTTTAKTEPPATEATTTTTTTAETAMVAVAQTTTVAQMSKPDGALGIDENGYWYKQDGVEIYTWENGPLGWAWIHSGGTGGGVEIMQFDEETLYVIEKIGSYKGYINPETGGVSSKYMESPDGEIIPMEEYEALEKAAIEEYRKSKSENSEN